MGLITMLGVVPWNVPWSPRTNTSFSTTMSKLQNKELPSMTLGKDATWWRYHGWHTPWIPRSLKASCTLKMRRMCGTISRTFFKGRPFRISGLLQELHSTEQGERSVTDFFTNLKALWEELDLSDQCWAAPVRLSVNVISLRRLSSTKNLSTLCVSWKVSMMFMVLWRRKFCWWNHCEYKSCFLSCYARRTTPSWKYHRS